MDHDWLHIHDALGCGGSYGDGIEGHRIFSRSRFTAKLRFVFRIQGRRLWPELISLRVAPPLPSPKVLLRRHRYNDLKAIPTDKTTVELSLSANDNYLIQIKAVSEGGEGAASEPIHIQRLSEFSLVPSRRSTFDRG